jgi:predicted transposase YbfD/YdcC
VRLAPSTATLRRVIVLACPGGLAGLTGADATGSDTIAVDGKTARGSRTGRSPAAHLLAAMTGDGRTVTQLRVPDKTNEITCFAALLEPYDLTGITVTADALHTQRDHARFLVEEKKAHYLLVVKANQPELHNSLRRLPWKDVTARRYDRETGHGRRETRATRALTVTDLGLDFPHAVRAVRILRHRTDLASGRCSRQTVYAITDLTSQQASPQRLGQLARLQWTIENRLHFVRDTTFGEDASKIRTGQGPENMATLRNLAINTLRQQEVLLHGLPRRRGDAGDEGRRRPPLRAAAPAGRGLRQQPQGHLRPVCLRPPGRLARAGTVRHTRLTPRPGLPGLRRWPLSRGRAGPVAAAAHGRCRSDTSGSPDRAGCDRTFRGANEVTGVA